MSNRVLARNHCSVSRDHHSLVCRFSCSRNLFSHLKLFCWKKRFLKVKTHLFRNFYLLMLLVFLRTCLGDEFVLINLLKVYRFLSSQVVLCKTKMEREAMIQSLFSGKCIFFDSGLVIMYSLMLELLTVLEREGCVLTLLAAQFS